jgi:hypothetical protein
MWDFWWSKWHWRFLRVLQFPLPILIPPTASHSSSFIIRCWYNKPNSGRCTTRTQAHFTPRNRKVKSLVHIEQIDKLIKIFPVSMEYKFHRRGHEQSSLYLILSHPNPFNILTEYFTKIHFNIVRSSRPECQWYFLLKILYTFSLMLDAPPPVLRFFF